MSNAQDNAAHTCSYSCDRPECIKAQRDELAAAAAQEAVAWLSKDEAQLALFKAIQAIRFGNPSDDKMILDNLRHEGLWIGRYANAPVTAAPVEPKSPSYDGLLLMIQSVCGALSRAGLTDCDDPGEAIDVIRERLEKRVVELERQLLARTPAAPGIDNTTPVDRGALQMAINVLRRAGKDEVADALIDASPQGDDAAPLHAHYCNAQPASAACICGLDSHKGALNEQFGSAEGLESPKGGSEAVSGGGTCGRSLAKARDAWMASDEARMLANDRNGPVAGKYLRNRLEVAFCAGYDAAQTGDAEVQP